MNAAIATVFTIWIAVAEQVKAAVRSRAGLVFTRAFREVVVDLDASDEEIARRKRLGEFVVGAEGYAAILDDDIARKSDAGLVVRSDAPPPPPPPIVERPTRVRAKLPAMWIEVANDLGLNLPVADRAIAEMVLTAALDVAPEPFTEPPLAEIWRRFARLVMIDDRGEEASRLRRAVSGALPITAGASVFAPAEVMPPVCAERYATNVQLPQWQATVARVIGLAAPGAYDNSESIEAIRVIAVEEHEALTTSPLDGAQRENGSRYVTTKPAPVRAEIAAVFDAKRAEVNGRAALKFTTWSESLDRVRRAVLASIDHALLTATDPPIVFALDQLARSGRRLAIGRSLDEDAALAIVLRSVRLSAAVVPELEPARVRLHVATKQGLPHRSRAGFVFTKDPISIECDEAQALLITRDNGLVTYEEKDLAAVRRQAIENATDEQIAAQLAANRAARAPRDGRITAGSADGRPTRISTTRKPKIEADTTPNGDPQ